MDPATDFRAIADFQAEAAELLRRMGGAGEEIGRVQDRLRHMRAAWVETPRADPELFRRMDELAQRLSDIQVELWGDPARGRLSEPRVPGLSGRAGSAAYGHWDTRQPPTVTMRMNLEIASDGFDELVRALSDLIEGDLMDLERDLAAAGAPWTPGRRLISG